MGSTQILPNGDAFVGWGSQPVMSEFDTSGKLVYDIVLPKPDLSYRAKVQQWVGRPLYPPVGAARQKGGKTVVYASWNGATKRRLVARSRRDEPRRPVAGGDDRQGRV